jgi:predicted phage terminase large subunit-like protein
MRTRKVVWPFHHQAPWLDAFKAEAAAFPNGRHDDQIDALSQLLGWIHRRRKTAGVW